ncbi:hypothetical protein B0H16DRAFT_1554210, partial [Mycena metata]
SSYTCVQIRHQLVQRELDRRARASTSMPAVPTVPAGVSPAPSLITPFMHSARARLSAGGVHEGGGAEGGGAEEDGVGGRRQGLALALGAGGGGGGGGRGVGRYVGGAGVGRERGRGRRASIPIRRGRGIARVRVVVVAIGRGRSTSSVGVRLRRLHAKHKLHPLNHMRVASRVRSFSAARWRSRSVEGVRVNLGGEDFDGSDAKKGKERHPPPLLLVELVAHALAQLLELALRLCVARVDHQVLEVP